MAFLAVNVFFSTTLKCEQGLNTQLSAYILLVESAAEADKLTCLMDSLSNIMCFMMFLLQIRAQSIHFVLHFFRLSIIDETCKDFQQTVFDLSTASGTVGILCSMGKQPAYFVLLNYI